MCVDLYLVFLKVLFVFYINVSGITKELKKNVIKNLGVKILYLKSAHIVYSSYEC